MDEPDACLRTFFDHNAEKENWQFIGECVSRRAITISCTEAAEDWELSILRRSIKQEIRLGGGGGGEPLESLRVPCS